MGFGEDGARATLENTLRLASEVYSDAGGGGITAVRFLNSRDVYFGVSSGQISSLMKRIVFEGVTNIGTRLRDKVLANHVTDDMKKPLLVIVLTDAEVRYPWPKNSDSALLMSTRSRARLTAYLGM